MFAASSQVSSYFGRDAAVMQGVLDARVRDVRVNIAGLCALSVGMIPHTMRARVLVSARGVFARRVDKAYICLLPRSV